MNSRRIVGASLLALACCVSGCASRPSLPTSWGGEVVAPTPAEAEALRDLVEATLPAVRQTLPGTAAPGRVELRHEPEFAGAMGRADRARGLIVVHALDALTLVHELVHFLDPAFDPLPPLVKEGLATWIGAGGCLPLDEAGAIHRELARRTLNEHAHRVGFGGGQPLLPVRSFDVRAALEMTNGRELPWRDRVYGTLLADGLMRRLGVDGLRALCAETRDAGLDVVPVDAVLTAAGCEPSTAGWIVLLAVAAPGLRSPASMVSVAPDEHGAPQLRLEVPLETF